VGICSDGCYRDVNPNYLTVAIHPTQEVNVPIIDHAALGQAVIVTVPAGALSASDNNNQYLYFGPVADSEVTDTYNYVRKNWAPFLGWFLPLSQTVLSAPFKCYSSSNVNSKFLQNVTVTASIDTTYNHALQDVCLATVRHSDKSWRCVQPMFSDRNSKPTVQVTATTVSSSFGECGSVPTSSTSANRGTTYAFIYSPGSSYEVKSNTDVLSNLAKMWPFIALGAICSSLLLIFLIWFCFRKLRYRSKYKLKRKQLASKKDEMQRMRDVGAAGANVGGIQAAMEHNPLQITVDNVNKLQSQIPSTEKYNEMIEKEVEVKKRREMYIAVLEERTAKLRSVVDGLKAALSQENQNLLGAGDVEDDSYSPGGSVNKVQESKHSQSQSLLNISV